MAVVKTVCQEEPAILGYCFCTAVEEGRDVGGLVEETAAGEAVADGDVEAAW